MVFSEQIKQNFINYSHEIIQGYDFGKFCDYFLSLNRLDSYELIKELSKLKGDDVYPIAILNLLSKINEITDLEVLLIPVNCYYHHNQIVRRMSLRCFQNWNDKVALFFMYQLLPDSTDYVESFRISVLYNLQQHLRY